MKIFYFPIFLTGCLISLYITGNKKAVVAHAIHKKISLTDTLPYKIISRGKVTGTYQAFPDACRLKNGDLVVVFYAGDQHVTTNNVLNPNAGRICWVRSHDEGKTWSEPEIIYDDRDDNRDPHVNQMSDGTILVSFFTLCIDQQNKNRSCMGCHIIKSADNGKTWEKLNPIILEDTANWYCSAKVREFPGGLYILPIYFLQHETHIAYGGVVYSFDKGITWSKPKPVGQESQKFLPAETDIVQLKDLTLFAALRGDFGKGKSVNMHYSISKDLGKTWTPVTDMGFQGHAPSFTRLKTGEIILSYRAFPKESDGYFKDVYTGFRVSYDEGQSWQGPFQIDKSPGAYPSTVELKDGTILAVYYEEGNGSAIRVLRFNKPKKENKILYEPQPVEALSLEN